MTTKLIALWKRFANRRYREAFVEAHLSSTIAAQIQTMRQDRNLTQSELAGISGMKQSRISLLEDPENTSLSISTLRRLAAAFNVALIVRFVPYSALARWSTEVRDSKFSVTPFEKDSPFPSRVTIEESSGGSRSIKAEAITFDRKLTREIEISTSDKTLMRTMH